jgi:transaldolase/glucose-6-phosphate isomerase
MGVARHLTPDLNAAVDREIADWGTAGKVKKLWDGDASLWTGKDESRWVGWLRIAAEQLAGVAHLTRFAEEVRSEGFEHAVVLGMGGSSLAPEVLARAFGRQPGFPALTILDSTDPSQIRTLEKSLHLARTLFIVSSKSGSTIEPNLYHRYFYEKTKAAVGAERVGRQFVAVTDPGSPLEAVVTKDGFRQIFHGVPSIGGRYSALSDFGMAPAAAMGLDVQRFLESAKRMADACGAPAAGNPGLELGAVLGALGNRGRDKLTIIASPAIADFGAWLEQLVAESTGKLGHGLIPVDGEPLGGPEVYGQDRLFAYLRLTPEANDPQEAAVLRLRAGGQPVIQIEIAGRYDLGGEFFRWEFATAVAGSILGINPFDQPDVEASKIETRKLTSEFEETGALPPEQPIFQEGGVKLFADPANAAALGSQSSLGAYLRAHLNRLRPGDYLALLAYVERNEEHSRALEKARREVRDTKRVATCVGFGPRFLHSTGQAYKGGPNSGVVLQITCDEAADLAVPGQRYTFGVVKAAQARGDFEVLAARGRRALRVHLPAPVGQSLRSLVEAIRTLM